MSGTQDLAELMAARRADLEGTAAHSTAAANGDVEVIPPAAEAPPETAAPAVAVPAGPLEVREAAPAPVSTAPPVTPDATFPVIPPKVLGGLPYANSYSRLAFSIHSTEMVPRQFRGKPPALMAAFMYGYEVGLGPMQAANGINVIDGSAGLDAETMRALILEQGHIFVLQQGRNPDTGEAWATVFCRRKDWPETIPTAEFTWTTERGKRAGLVEWYEKWTQTNQGRNRKLVWNPHSDEETPDWVFPANGREAELKSSSAWKNYPEAMCGARATSEAARANFADVVKGLSYTPEEIREFNGGVGDSAMPEGDPPSAPPQTPPDSSPGSDSSSSSSSTSETETESASASPDVDPSPSTTAPTSSSSSTSSSEPTGPAKKARGARKAAPPKEPQAPPPAETSTLPAGTDTSSSDEPPAPDAPAGEAVQPDLAGNTPAAEPDAPPPEDEAGVIRELATSLRSLLQAKPQADRQLITVFLGRHFPGRKAEELDADELTKAINIAAGWPGSAETYPPPDPDPVDAH